LLAAHLSLQYFPQAEDMVPVNPLYTMPPAQGKDYQPICVQQALQHLAGAALPWSNTAVISTLRAV
jgi:hypothetical protein